MQIKEGSNKIFFGNLIIYYKMKEKAKVDLLKGEIQED